VPAGGSPAQVSLGCIARPLSQKQKQKTQQFVLTGNRAKLILKVPIVKIIINRYNIYFSKIFP
jgi:hypothetical protein